MQYAENINRANDLKNIFHSIIMKNVANGRKNKQKIIMIKILIREKLTNKIDCQIKIV